MQKFKNYKLIITAALLLLGCALLLNNYTKSDSIKFAGELLYPYAKDKLAIIEEVTIDNSINKLNLRKDSTSNTWIVKDKDNYPIAFNKIKDLLIGIAELKIIEPKTNNPDNFANLSLASINKDEINNTLRIEAKTNTGEVVINLLLGKREGRHLRSQYTDEIYVRKNNDNQVWLVTGKLPTAFNFANLVAQPLLKLAAADIKFLSIQHPNQPGIILYKDKKEDLDYKLQVITKEQKIKAQYLMNVMPATVANLTFEDVIPVAFDKNSWTDSTVIKFKTFTNQEAILNLKPAKDLVMLKVVSTLNLEPNNIKNWIYIFQRSDLENLFKTRTDLVANIK